MDLVNKCIMVIIPTSLGPVLTNVAKVLLQRYEQEQHVQKSKIKI